MHPGPLLLPLALSFLAAGLPSQVEKLHPHLFRVLQDSEPDALVPAYFVMADRLGYEHWFPRVQRLGLPDRRAQVIAELREHAQASQADLLAYLWGRAEDGAAEAIRSNWVGNFVQVRAVPAVIREAAARHEVELAWFDHVPAPESVEDSAAVEDAAAGRRPHRPVSLPRMDPPVAGDGPVAARADQAWALGYRGQGVVVMNADSGLNVRHGDLAARLWHNPGEIPGNGEDDDGNGLVDDVHGWNFAGGNGDLDDLGGHGTQVAGCIVGDGTCSGTITGAAPDARLMGARLGGETSQWNAVQYALEHGADVLNSSHSYKLWFNPPPNYRMHREVGEASLAAGLIRVNSTSNDGNDCSLGLANSRPCNIAAPGNLPPPYLDPNQTLRGALGGVIGVGAWDWRTDALIPFSPCGPFAWSLADVRSRRPDYPDSAWDSGAHDDYPWQGGASQGLLKPDIAAPTTVLTTAGGGTGCELTVLGGTSASAPLTAGCLALWKGANPSLTPEDAALILHQTARDRGSVAGKENDWGAGVIDAVAGLKRALAVHRVNGQSVWELEHSVGTALEVQVDGLPMSLSAIGLGFSRTDYDLGVVTLGIGDQARTLWSGFTDAAGNGGGPPLTVHPLARGLTIYTQAFVVDLNGVTGEILASNVIAVTFTQ